MDTNINEVYAVFGELIAVQGITTKRLQALVGELQEKLMLAQRQIEKLEGKDGTGDGDPGEHNPNGHSGREVPLAEGDGQAGGSSLSSVA